jgi:hypothetical protein
MDAKPSHESSRLPVGDTPQPLQHVQPDISNAGPDPDILQASPDEAEVTHQMPDPDAARPVGAAALQDSTSTASETSTAPENAGPTDIPPPIKPPVPGSETSGEREAVTKWDIIIESAAKEPAFHAARAANPNTRQAWPGTIEAKISATKGPVLEVGGIAQPLEHPPIVDFAKVDKPVVHSAPQDVLIQAGRWENIFSGKETVATSRPDNVRGVRGLATGFHETEDRYPQNYAGIDATDPRSGSGPLTRQPDLYLDPNKLPEGTGYLGAIYACRPTSLPGHPNPEHQLVDHGAPRTLEPNGILALDGVAASTVAKVHQSPYFDVLQERIRTSGGVRVMPSLDLADLTTPTPPQSTFHSVVAQRNDQPYQPPQPSSETSDSRTR